MEGEQRLVLALCDGEWVQVQASSALGPQKKVRPVEETITDKQPKSIHIYLYREYTQLEETPDSLSSNGECVTGTVKAPTV